MEGQNKNPLIDDFNNNVAGIKAFNHCITLGNVLNDNKNRLICVDTNNYLKVFDGEVLQTETKLHIIPVGIVSYFSIDKITKTKAPFVAVAGGIYIYIYKNLKGSLKIPIPDQNSNSVEVYIYDKLYKGEITPKECLSLLEKLSDKLSKGKKDEENEDRFEDIIGKVEEDSKVLEDKYEELSSMTLELFTLKNEKQKLEFLEKNNNKCIKIYNYITLISSIFEDESYSEDSISYLIIGTENSMIMVIDPKENKIISRKKLSGVPFLISSYGGYLSDHKMIIGDRGCNIYVMKKSEILRTILVPQPLVSLLCCRKSIYLGTIGRNYISLKPDGDRVFSLPQPNTITCMELAERVNDEILVLIATKDSDLRIYRDDKLCVLLKFGDTIFGMKFGRYGEKRESLIMFTYGGALFVKYFNDDVRVSQLEYKDTTGEDIEKTPIDTPKKTYLYQDLVNREKECNSEMHNKFISDLVRIRYKAMSTYVRMLKIGNAPQNYSSSSNMKISATLEGLGPNFKLNIIFNNTGKDPIYGAVLTLDFNRKIFRFEKENIQLSIIMPNIAVNYSLPFRNISENGASGNIKVIVIDKMKPTPLIQSTIRVPISELDIF